MERYCVFFFIFCLEPKAIKYTCMWLTSVTVMVIFWKVLFWKLLDHSHVQSSLSTITGHTVSNVLKNTQKSRNLRWSISIRPNSFIKTLVIMMKQKSTKLHWKWLVACASKDISLIFSSFCFTQTSSLTMCWFALAYWASIGTIYFSFYLFIIIWYSTDLEVHPVPGRFFLKKM